MSIGNSTDRFNGVVASLAIKVPVKRATNVNQVLSGDPGTIDGYTWSDGDRILLWGQTDPVENGIWCVNTTSAWSRAPDFDGNRDATQSTFLIAERSVGSAVMYILDTADPIVIGTTSLSFSLFFDPDSPVLPTLQQVTDTGNTTDDAIIITEPGGGRQLEMVATTNPVNFNLSGSASGIQFLGAISEYFFNIDIRVAGDIYAQSNGLVYGSNGLGTELIGITHDDTDGILRVTGATTPLRFEVTSAIIEADGAFFIQARAADLTSRTGYGQFWVDSADGLPYFTTAADVVYALASQATGGIADNQIAIGTASNGLEGDADLTYDGVALEIGQGTGNKYVRWYDSVANFVQMRMSGTTNSLFVEGTAAEMVMDSCDLRFRDNIDLYFGESNDVGFTWNATNLITTALSGEWQMTGFTNIDIGTADLTIGNMLFDNSLNFLRIGDGTDSLTMQQQTDLFSFSFSGVATFELSNLTGGQILRDGAYLRLNGPADTAYVQFEHDDTDLNITENATTDINFPAAGTLGLNMSDNELVAPILKDYAIEDPGEYTPTGTTQTLTYSDGPAFQVDLESVTGNITITLSGGPPTGTYGQIIVKVTQDSTVARTITWAGGTFRWAGGVAHVMNSTLNGFSIYTFETWDGGTSWWGAGEDYS